MHKAFTITRTNVCRVDGGTARSWDGVAILVVFFGTCVKTWQVEDHTTTDGGSIDGDEAVVCVDGHGADSYERELTRDFDGDLEGVTTKVRSARAECKSRKDTLVVCGVEVDERTWVTVLGKECEWLGGIHSTNIERCSLIVMNHDEEPTERLVERLVNDGQCSLSQLASLFVSSSCHGRREEGGSNSNNEESSEELHDNELIERWLQVSV